jgi:ribonuclease HI
VDVTIHIAALRLRGRGACGIVVTAQEAAQALHELSAAVEAPSLGAVEYQAMLRAIETVAPLAPQSVELCCLSRRIIDQITGAEQVPQRLEALHERLTVALLKIDNWRLSVAEADSAHRQRARKLAHAVMKDPEPTPAQLPATEWAVRFEGDAAQCPAGCGPGVDYIFGAAAPAGFCLHALPAVLAALPGDSQTMCPRCHRAIQLRRIT